MAKPAGMRWRHPFRALRQFAQEFGQRIAHTDDAALQADSGGDADDISTQLPPTRGQALREAHRTLRERMRSHKAIRKVLPHLSAIERSLAKRGSRALDRLPVGVLQRGLEQLAMLQHDDESMRDAVNLRVLRLRLIEAIALRTSQDSRPTLDDVPTPRPRQRSDEARRRDRAPSTITSYTEHRHSTNLWQPSQPPGNLPH